MSAPLAAATSFAFREATAPSAWPAAEPMPKNAPIQNVARSPAKLRSGASANATRAREGGAHETFGVTLFRELGASAMQKKPFSELGLSPEILKAVEKLGYEEATPIQSAAIPVLLGGRDLVGQSQTGSGKTAAF